MRLYFKMTMRWMILVLFLALLVAIGSGCRDRLANGGTETTNGTVTGIALYPDGKVAVGARVRLRPSGYLAGMYLGSEDSVDLRWEGKSDSEGKFKLSGLKEGDYGLEINDGKSFGTWVKFFMGADLETVAVTNATLARTATLSGTIKSTGQLSGQVTYIRVFGLERLVFADRDGNFVIPELPAGSYALRINVASPYFDSVTLAENIVNADSDTKVGEIRLPLQSCANFTCDSLAARAILNANGKQNQTVNSVITRDRNSGRIIALRFTNMGFEHLPDEIGSLTALKTLRFQGNKFKTLPQSLVNLPVLEILDLEDNLLIALPDRLGEMTSLIDLKLSNNKLNALPEGLGKLQHLKQLSLSRTPLRFLPEDISQCKSLSRLDLTADSLTTLPFNLGDLVSLRSLFLDSNQLTNLPESMTQLDKLDTLFLNGNRFCTPLSPTLEAWIRIASGDGLEWNNRQNCPIKSLTP